MTDRVVVIPDALPDEDAGRIEGALDANLAEPRGWVAERVGFESEPGPRRRMPGGWWFPVHAAIVAHQSKLAAPWPKALHGRFGEPVIRDVTFGEPDDTELTNWHVDNLAMAHGGEAVAVVIWYGGDFDGGALEVEGAGVWPVRRNCLLAHDTRRRHRVLPVTRGRRWGVVFAINGAARPPVPFIPHGL